MIYGGFSSLLYTEVILTNEFLKVLNDTGDCTYLFIAGQSVAARSLRLFQILKVIQACFQDGYHERSI